MTSERERLIEEGELMAKVEGLSPGELEFCLKAGWIVPAEAPDASLRRYLDVDVARLRLIHELRFELELGDEAVPVILQLIDQLHGLRYGILRLKSALAGQPEPVRRAIADAFADPLED
jgi:chaperone modulatory protein CbpM